jgi:hypothetical protein
MHIAEDAVTSLNTLASTQSAEDCHRFTQPHEASDLHKGYDRFLPCLYILISHDQLCISFDHIGL